jgi:hypothetical protein
MAQPTFNKSSVNMRFKDHVVIQSLVVNDDNIDFTVTYHIPPGFLGRIYRYEELLPGFALVGEALDGQTDTFTNKNPFSRHAFQTSFEPQGGMYSDLVLRIYPEGGAQSGENQYFNIMPEVDLQAYTNNKAAPAMWRIWDYFDSTSQWGNLETETYTHEIDLKNGYFAQGHIVTFTEGIPTGEPVSYKSFNYPKIADADFRFVELGDIGSVAKYPFNTNSLGTGDKPIGTANIQVVNYNASPTADQVVIWVSNTSGAAVSAAHSPTLRLLIVYRKA